MVSLGSGGASGGHPDVPDLFIWRDEASSSDVLFVFDHGYGGGLHVLPDGTAIYCAWNTDNSGPMAEAAVLSVYAGLRARYPNANVHASSFDAFYDAYRALSAEQRDRLPVVTREIGDTWLYGVPSDPLKNMHFREMSRHRRACVAKGACDPEDLTMQRFDRLLTKIPEHTWGEDTTWYLGDDANWTNAQAHPLMRTAPNYRMSVESWLDQRSFLSSALGVLTKSAQPAYVGLAEDIKRSLESAKPRRPEPVSLRAAGYARAAGTTAAEQSAQVFGCHGWELAFGMDASLRLLDRIDEHGQRASVLSRAGAALGR